VIDSLYQQLPWLYYGLLTLLSLLVGSFLNVLIHRLPIMLERGWRQEFADYFEQPLTPDGYPSPYNLWVPRSACPHCGHALGAAENIPLLSWLWQRGRCRHCHQPVSFRYPLVELLSALAGLAVASQFAPGAPLLAALLLSWTLLALTFIDLDKLLLPDQLTLPLLWGGLLFNLVGGFVSLEEAVAGAMVGYLLLWSLYWLFKLATGKEGMGYGDFKLLAALGAWQGWQALPLILLLSSLVGAITGISLLLLRRHQQGKPLPFGPYLALAGWVALLWGPAIGSWYLERLA